MPVKYIGTVPGFAQRTPVTQSGIRDDLFEFNNPYIQMPDNLCLKLSLSKAYYHAFRLQRKVQLIHLNDVFEQDLDIWTKSPGIPWLENGYKTKNDIRHDPEAIRKIRYFWHRVKGGEQLRAPDCLAYVHSICPVEEVVWDYPATITFGEAVFCLPLIRAYKESGPFAYGYETATGGMKKICNRFDHYKHYAGLNFKKFDKTVPVWLIDKAFLVLMSNVDFGHYQGHGVPDARKMAKMWDYLIDYFINTTIRTANGLRFRKSSGIASGSYFTQLIGSVCNYILCQWMTLEQTGNAACDIIVQGDNSLVATTVPLRLDECQRLMNSIGMAINMEKSQITGELTTMKFLETIGLEQ